MHMTGTPLVSIPDGHLQLINQTRSLIKNCDIQRRIAPQGETATVSAINQKHRKKEGHDLQTMTSSVVSIYYGLRGLPRDDQLRLEAH